MTRRDINTTRAIECLVCAEGNLKFVSSNYFDCFFSSACEFMSVFIRIFSFTNPMYNSHGVVALLLFFTDE